MQPFLALREKKTPRARSLPSMSCAWGISGNCHECMKKWKVCKACWNEASEQQKEDYKMIEENFCKTVGCWEWSEEGRYHCAKCMVEYKPCRAARDDRSRSSHRKGSPQTPKAAFRTSSRPPIESRTNPKMIEAFLKLGSEEIADIIKEGVDELARRL